MQIHPAGDELFHAEERTDRYDEDNSFFFYFANAPNCEPTELVFLCSN